MFVYLHGFNSSPESFKARLLHERLAELGREGEFVAPALPPRPDAAIAAVQSVLADCDPRDVTLVGSSLGGHYATWLAERHACRAVLVNPAIAPHELLANHLGPQANLHTGATYELTRVHLDLWRAQHVQAVTHPERYMLVVATHDEVLDSQVSIGRFRGATQIVHRGGDHGFGEFAQYVDAVIAFGDGHSLTTR